MSTETKVAHTPGPWTFQPDATFSTLGDQRIVGADRISPGIVFGGIAECEPNARLIAAAPELLAACRRALEEGGQLNGATRRGDIRAAIAKAEGK